MKSVQLGGNKLLFDILKEYDIANPEVSIPMKYKHPALRWFRRRHESKLDGRYKYFDEEMPAKNINERVNKTKAKIKKNIDELNPKMQEFENKSVDFSLKVDQKLNEFGNKIASTSFMQSVSRKFGKLTNRDSNNRRPSMEGQ